MPIWPNLPVDTPPNRAYCAYVAHQDTLSPKYSRRGRLDSNLTIWTTLQRVVAGDPGVLWINRPGELARLRAPLRSFDSICSTLGYTAIGDEWPMVHIVETQAQMYTAAVSPPSWTRNDRRRLDRDVDRFMREMQRGELGRVFKCFELLECAELLPILTEIVNAPRTTTH